MEKLRLFKAAAILLGTCLLFPACNDNNDQELIDQEMSLLQKYIEDHNITQEPTESGLYYIPITEGTGTQVESGSWVDFEYNVTLIDGTLLYTSDEEEAQDNDLYIDGVLYGAVRLPAGNTGVPGLNEGLLFMREGGKARMIMPSSINGFGGTATSRSPAYSTHIYTIELIHAFTDPESFENEQISQYLADSLSDDVLPTESGLYFFQEAAGEGDLITENDVADIWYTGSFLDGRVFGSNVGGDVLSVDLSMTNYYIQGIIEALKLMRPLGRATVIIPYDLAYGESGFGNIPAYMTLVFEIEVEEVNSGL